jgi:hypothetical protein
MSQDRGYARSLWLGALHHCAARFVLRWRHQYRLLFEGKLKAAWKIATSVKRPGAVAGCGMRGDGSGRPKPMPGRESWPTPGAGKSK